LSDIASNFGESKDELTYARDLIESKVQTRLKPPEEEKDDVIEEQRAFMVSIHAILPHTSYDQESVPQPASTVHCNIAFGELVVNFPEDHIVDNVDTIMPVLIDVLHDVPFIDFDQSLSWEGVPMSDFLNVTNMHPVDWSLPDQLVFSTVSALLRISASHSQYSEAATNAIFAFVTQVVKMIKSRRCEAF
jgi:phosphatidylinositol 4-kinase A